MELARRLVLSLWGLKMSEEHEWRVCDKCGVMSPKDDLWDVSCGYYLCDDCYWEDLERDCTDE